MGAEVESNVACIYNHVGLPKNISSVGRCRPHTPPLGNDSPRPRHFLCSPHRPPALAGSHSHPTPHGLGASPPVNRLSFEFPLSLPAHLLPSISNSVEKSGFAFPPESTRSVDRGGHLGGAQPLPLVPWA